MSACLSGQVSRGRVSGPQQCPAWALALLLVCGALVVGCDGVVSYKEPDLVPPPIVIFPDTQDKLMRNFMSVHSHMNLEKYQEVLHPNFRFLFKPEDAVRIPSDILERDGELVVAHNMFSGDARPQPDGPPEPGISRITISVLNRKTDWTAVAPSNASFYEPEDAEHGRHASLQATFGVQMQIERDQGSQLLVAGDTVFFVASRDSLVAGVVKPYYQLRGQQDLTHSTGGKLAPSGSDETSWGTVKILYGSWN